MNLPQTINPDELPDEDAPPFAEGESTLVEVSAKVRPPFADDAEMALLTAADTPMYAALRLRMNAESVGREIAGPITVEELDEEDRPA